MILLFRIRIGIFSYRLTLCSCHTQLRMHLIGKVVLLLSKVSDSLFLDELFVVLLVGTLALLLLGELDLTEDLGRNVRMQVAAILK